MTPLYFDNEKREKKKKKKKSLKLNHRFFLYTRDTNKKRQWHSLKAASRVYSATSPTIFLKNNYNEY